jgi:hypothetical protein
MDPIQCLIDLLSNDAALTALLGTVDVDGVRPAIFGGALIEHYDPTSLPALTIHVRGGQTHAEMPLAAASVGITCWAGINQFWLARKVYGAVYDAIQRSAVGFDSGEGTGRILLAYEETLGQDVTDPDAGWATVLSFYNVTVVPSTLQ